MTTDFQAFWNAYALKRDRIAAERAWKKLPARDRKAAIDGIERYKTDCAKRGISRMYAQGYLNHRRWEDEEDTDTAPEKSAAPAESPVMRDVSGNRVSGGITEDERKNFELLKLDLLRAWSRHRDERNAMALHELLDRLELYGINDVARAIYLRCTRGAFNREFVVPWFWMPEMFDRLVASRFNGYHWLVFL